MNYRVHYQTSEIIFADKASHGHSEKVKVHEICFIERGRLSQPEFSYSLCNYIAMTHRTKTRMNENN